MEGPEMPLQDFSNLYGSSVGVIAVSGALQELVRIRVSTLREAIGRLYQMESVLTFDEQKNDYIDKVLPDLERKFDKETGALQHDLKSYKLLSWAGIVVPVVCMYYGATANYDVGSFLILVTLILSYGWGVAAYLLVRIRVNSALDPIESELAEHRARILS